MRHFVLFPFLIVFKYSFQTDSFRQAWQLPKYLEDMNVKLLSAVALQAATQEFPEREYKLHSSIFTPFKHQSQDCMDISSSQNSSVNEAQSKAVRDRIKSDLSALQSIIADLARIVNEFQVSVSDYNSHSWNRLRFHLSCIKYPATPSAEDVMSAEAVIYAAIYNYLELPSSETDQIYFNIEFLRQKAYEHIKLAETTLLREAKNRIEGDMIDQLDREFSKSANNRSNSSRTGTTSKADLSTIDSGPNNSSRGNEYNRSSSCSYRHDAYNRGDDHDYDDHDYDDHDYDDHDYDDRRRSYYEARPVRSCCDRQSYGEKQSADKHHNSSRYSNSDQRYKDSDMQRSVLLTVNIADAKLFLERFLADFGYENTHEFSQRFFLLNVLKSIAQQMLELKTPRKPCAHFYVSNARLQAIVDAKPPKHWATFFYDDDDAYRPILSFLTIQILGTEVQNLAKLVIWIYKLTAVISEVAPGLDKYKVSVSSWPGNNQLQFSIYRLQNPLIELGFPQGPLVMKNYVKLNFVYRCVTGCTLSHSWTCASENQLLAFKAIKRLLEDNYVTLADCHTLQIDPLWVQSTMQMERFDHSRLAHYYNLFKIKCDSTFECQVQLARILWKIATSLKQHYCPASMVDDSGDDIQEAK